jgi:hypothetical protein
MSTETLPKGSPTPLTALKAVLGVLPFLAYGLVSLVDHYGNFSSRPLFLRKKALSG